MPEELGPLPSQVPGLDEAFQAGASAPPAQVGPETGGDSYPVDLEIPYRAPLGRLSTLFRWPLVLPPVLFLLLVAWPALFGFMVASRLALFLRRRHPDWLFDFEAGLLGFGARIQAYAYLLTDRYPAFSQEEGAPVRVSVARVTGDRSRWRGLLWRLTLAVPHLVVLTALSWALSAVSVLAFFAILFTGRYPEGLFGFAAGVIRWETRLIAYLLLLTDEFPPFTLESGASRASRRSAVLSAVSGLAVLGSLGLATVAAVVVGSRPEHTTADYDRLVAGTRPHELRYPVGDGGLVILRLQRVHDPAPDLVRGAVAGPGERLVVFEWRVQNLSDARFEIRRDLRLAFGPAGAETVVTALAVTVDAERTPETIGPDASETVLAVFSLPSGARPRWLEVEQSMFPFVPWGGLRYEFE